MKRLSGAVENTILLVLLALGLCARLFACVFFRFSMNPDFGVNGLMVRHIAMGRHFPLFFYGQSYMGAPEAYISAGFYRLLGHSMFAVMLGPALVSTVALVFLYLWVKELGGKWAGLLALWLFILGSSTTFYCNVFFGYPALLLSGFACCWCACRIISIWHRERRVARIVPWYILLGLIGGFGWWSNNMAAIFLAPCALTLLCAIPFRANLRVAIPALLAFLAGAFPWVYSLIRDPTVLVFVQEVGQTNAAVNLNLFAEYFLGVFDLAYEKPLHLIVGVLALLAILGCWGGALVDAYRRRRTDGMPWPLLLPVLVIVFTLLSCVTSARFAHVPAARYLLPAYPAILAMLAVGTVWAFSRFRFGWVIIVPLVIFFVWQLRVALPRSWPSLEDETVSPKLRRVSDLEVFCEQEGVSVLRGDFRDFYLSFVTEERLRLCTYPDYDRYRPYREEAANSLHVGVLDYFRGFAPFLERTGSTASEKNVARHVVQFDFSRPEAPFSYLPSGEILVASDAPWDDPTKLLLDRDIDTPWSGMIAEDAVEHGNVWRTRFHFKREMKLLGIRVLGASGTKGFLRDISLTLNNGERISVLEDGQKDGWFWSGPQFYPDGVLAFGEYVFSPRMVTEVELGIPTNVCGLLGVSEVLFMVEDDWDYEEVPPRHLAGLLRAKGVTFLYAPRWISEWVHLNAKDVPTIIPEDYYEQYDGFDRKEQIRFPIQNQRGTALLTPQESADMTRDQLVARQWLFREESTGPWALFLLSGEGGTPEVARALFWTELGCFSGERAEERGNAEFVRRQLAEQLRPALDVPIRFRNGAVLEGITSSTNEVRAGDRFVMDYYWRCPPKVDPHKFAVFVHFDSEGDGETVFQDDHIFLRSMPLKYIQSQSQPETFRERRRVTVPAGTAPGTYRIGLGLYRPNTGERLSVKTPLPNHRRKVTVPFGLIVTE